MRAKLFLKEEDYAAFERILDEAILRVTLRNLGHCVMPNHWHMVGWPRDRLDHEVSDFLRWLTVTHAQRWHAHYPRRGPGICTRGGTSPSRWSRTSTSTRCCATSSAIPCGPTQSNGRKTGDGRVSVATPREATRPANCWPPGRSLDRR